MILWIFNELHSSANNIGLLCSNIIVLLKRIWITLAKTLQAEKLDETEKMWIYWMTCYVYYLISCKWFCRVDDWFFSAGFLFMCNLHLYYGGRHYVDLILYGCWIRALLPKQKETKTKKASHNCSDVFKSCMQSSI